MSDYVKKLEDLADLDSASAPFVLVRGYNNSETYEDIHTALTRTRTSDDMDYVVSFICQHEGLLSAIEQDLEHKLRLIREAQPAKREQIAKLLLSRRATLSRALCKEYSLIVT